MIGNFLLVITTLVLQEGTNVLLLSLKNTPKQKKRSSFYLNGDEIQTMSYFLGVK